jgi:hypothetical protein
LVEDEVLVVTPLTKEPPTKAGALNALEPLRGDDLIGVDVAALERYGATFNHVDGLHGFTSSGVAK